MDVKLLELEKEYERYAKECQCGMRTVMARLENLKSEMELSPKRSPFKSITSRIKCFDSAVEKCKRRKDSNGESWPITMETFKQKMHDIAGVRIITPYQDDIYTVRNAVVRQPSMTVIEERDYVKNPKQNGYRSLHLIVEMEIYFMETSKRVPVEIQIRSEAMELWASQDHRLRYKNDDPSPEAIDKLSTIAKILADFEQQIMELRDFRNKEEDDLGEKADTNE